MKSRRMSVEERELNAAAALQKEQRPSRAPALPPALDLLERRKLSASHGWTRKNLLASDGNVEDALSSFLVEWLAEVEAHRGGLGRGRRRIF